MSDFKLPPSTASQRAIAPAAQAARQVAQPAAQVPAAAPASQPVGDKVVSRALQGGQANTSVAFVESTPTPPSKADLAWALNLEKSVKKGYQPSEAEFATYKKIADQLEACTPMIQPDTSPVTARESAWALDLEARVKQGAEPTGKEIASYRNIAVRLLKAEQVPPPPAGVSEDEMAWARNLQRRVTQEGYQPAPKELEAYNDIYTRSQAKQPQPAKVPMSDLAWANQLQQRIGQGYQPSETERQRYLEIYNATQAQKSPELRGVSADESKWALELQDKVTKMGYRPTQAELDRYGDISDRLMLQDPESIHPGNGVVSQHELDWAGRLQERVRSGIPASDEELERYQAIHQRNGKG